VVIGSSAGNNLSTVYDETASTQLCVFKFTIFVNGHGNSIAGVLANFKKVNKQSYE